MWERRRLAAGFFAAGSSCPDLDLDAASHGVVGPVVGERNLRALT